MTLVKSYRYLRLAIVGATVLLLVGVAVQAARDELLTSISAHYYTPAHDVFVGAVLAAALGLLAVRGRPGVENVQLNLAGVLLPLVAFIPTPLREGTTVSDVTVDCPDGWDACVPTAFVPGVEVSLRTLVVLGLLGLAIAFFTIRGEADVRRADQLGFGTAVAVWAVVTALVFADEASTAHLVLLGWGHYAAAVLAFGLLVLVGVSNGRRSEQQLSVRGFRAPFAMPYRVIAGLMAATVVMGGVLAVATDSAGSRLVLWVELALLLLFIAFWSLQTWEFWEQGVPPEVESADAS